MESPRQIEAILKFGSKSSTYKYALLKALIDYVIEHPTEDSENGFHYVPGIYLAKKFLRYYWPLWKSRIRQGSSERTAIEGYFEAFEAEFSALDDEGFSLDTAEAVLKMLERIETATDLPTPYVKLLQQIRRTVIEMPVRHVRNVRGEVAPLFTAYLDGHSLVRGEFDTIIQKGSNQIIANSRAESYLQLEMKEHFHILIASRVYEELQELRFWIDSIITRQWYEQCLAYQGDEESFDHGAFFRVLSTRFGEREPLNQYQSFYRENGFIDFYTGDSLPSSFDVDHFLPWSRLPVNRFWNLVPTRPTINRKKSDRLLSLTDEFRYRRLPEHLDRCLSTDDELIKTDLTATYQKFYKRPAPDNQTEKVEQLRELVLRIYDNLDSVTVEKKITPEELVA